MKSKSAGAAQQRDGYAKKPLWIQSLAYLLIANPFLSFVSSLYRLDIPQWYHPKTWAVFVQKIPMDSWSLVAMTMIAGLSLLLVRRYTLIIATACLLFLFSYNFFIGNRFLMLLVLIPASMWLSPFKKPYLDENLRWWEQFPRFSTQGEKAKIADNDSIVPIVNISQSGMLVEIPKSAKLPPRGYQFHCVVNDGFQVECEVMRAEGRMVGLQFIKMGKEQRKALRTFISQLQRLDRNKVTGNQPSNQNKGPKAA